MRWCRRMAVLLCTFILILLTANCGGSGGSGGSGGGGGGTGGGPAAASVYVTQVLNLFAPPVSMIMQFSGDANGNVNPISTLTGPDKITFQGLAVDGAGNLYVGGVIFSNNPGNQGQLEILVYGAGASGQASPKRNITGATTGLEGFTQNSISGLAVDGSGNIYVSSGLNMGGVISQGISVFAPTSDGDVAPIKVIAGDATNISFPGQIAVDSAGNIYVANSPVVLIFDAASKGNAAPTGSLDGSETTIQGVAGVAVDSAGNIYVANTVSGNGLPDILEFSAGSTGNVAPIRTISGLATMMTGIGNLSLDSDGNIYVLNGDNILKFAPGSTGNVAPTSIISSHFFANFNIAVH
jgi:hypothetical protein